MVDEEMLEAIRKIVIESHQFPDERAKEINQFFDERRFELKMRKSILNKVKLSFTTVVILAALFTAVSQIGGSVKGFFEWIVR